MEIFTVYAQQDEKIPILNFLVLLWQLEK